MNNEDKKKNIIIILLSVLVLGLLTFICVDKLVLNNPKEKENNSENKSEEKDNNDDNEPEEKVDENEITAKEIETMKEQAESLFEDKKELNFNEFNNQKKLGIALTIVESSTNKSISEVKGKELVDAVKKYYGTDAKIELEDIRCYLKEYEPLYSYNPNSDSFALNPKHQGHGLSATYEDRAGAMLFFDSAEKKENEYHIVMGVFYNKKAIVSDDLSTAPAKEDGKIYSTKEDLMSGQNLLFDPSSDETLYSTEYGYYDYDYDKIYEKIRDKVRKFEFTFIKDGETFIFVEAKEI